MKLAACLSFLTLSLLPAAADEAKQWQVYDGYNPEGYGRHIVFISGDEEYRSEESLPMLAKIMAVRHGFKCTVLFAQDPMRPGIINPQVLDHIPGLEALPTADLMVIATRFRALPDNQMEEIDAYLKSGRPVVGLRTANHGFRFKDPDSKWAHYSWQYHGSKTEWKEGFGGLILGSWYFSHHGWHKYESTRGIVEKGAEKNEILRGIELKSVWGPTDVYGVKEPIPGEDVKILLRGQVLTGMNPDDKPLGKGPYEKAPDYIREGSNDKNDPMQALAWTRSYQIPGGRKGRGFCTTMGASTDLVAEGTRRLIANAMFWCLGMEIPGKTDVDFVDPYEPTEYHTHKREYWEERQLKVSDFDLKAQLYEPGGEPHGEPAAAYFDVRGGREGFGYDFADHPVNRHRLYNFYRRQAEFYLDPKNEIPPVIPNIPDLDGGPFGHWGKFHKNGYKDRRWNLMDTGPAMSGIFRVGVQTLPQSVAVKLDHGLNVAFDPVVARYSHSWEGDFVRFNPGRWGIGNGIMPGGGILVTATGDEGWRNGEQQRPKIEYRGYYRWGSTVIFHYLMDGEEIWDSPDADKSKDGPEFTRLIQFGGGVGYRAHIETSRLGSRMGVAMSLKDMALSGGPALYADKSITLSGKIGESIPGTPFAIDRIPVPHHNEFGSMFFIGGHDFFANGDAAVCTMMGDVWRVSGLDAELKKVTWTRIATGLSQALGLCIYEDIIHVTCRDRIMRLHDLNGDWEIDFYENFCDDYPVSAGGHDFSTGLQRDSNGYFYFVTANNGVMRVSPDGKTAESMATGLRNTNGIGVSPINNTVVTSTNQGDWTPASAIFEIREGDFYGRGARKDGAPIAPPLCYLPRGIDNSSGGQIFVSSKEWGPLRGQLLSFSFGAGTWQMILRSTTKGKRNQGAVVPLPGDFESGAHRGRFNPVDGQLYVTGADGWGNYAITDGSFARVRYTGDENCLLPTGWMAHKNGLMIELAQPIDPTSAKPENFFAQTWNYEYAASYGSLEYSLKQPALPGHDHLPVKSVTVLGENDWPGRLANSAIFIEIPDIQPAMQAHLFGKLKSVSGEEFELNLFPTLLWLRNDWKGIDGYTASDPDKATDLELRVRWPIPFTPKHPQGNPGRKIAVTMVSGLQYEQKEIHAKAGEQITIDFRNLDSIPHNWVLVKPGAYEKVGTASNLMLTNPKAAEMHYVPESDDVLHYSPMLYHNKRHSLHITAPETPGRYPYLCTFPGHWAVMKGELIVE